MGSSVRENILVAWFYDKPLFHSIFCTLPTTPFEYNLPAVSKSMYLVERIGTCSFSASRIVSGRGRFPGTMIIAEYLSYKPSELYQGLSNRSATTSLLLPILEHHPWNRHNQLLLCPGPIYYGQQTLLHPAVLSSLVASQRLLVWRRL